MTERTKSEKVLKYKAFKIASNAKYDGYEKGFASMVHRFFDKNSTSLVNKSVKGIVIKCQTTTCR